MQKKKMRRRMRKRDLCEMKHSMMLMLMMMITMKCVLCIQCLVGVCLMNREVLKCQTEVISWA